MHQKPDPDAMGSALALAGVLTQLGHQVTVISPTNWPDFLKWMPGSKAVIDFEGAKEKAEAILNKAEWLFCLDFNIFTRTKNLSPHLYAFKGTKVLIDHHQQPDTANFDYGISDTAKSSTSEMVYDLIVQSGNQDKINSAIAFGADNAVTKVSQGLNIEIHDFVQINLAGFRKIIDSIDGVTLRVRAI